MRNLFLLPLLLLGSCSTPAQHAAESALREAHIDPATTGSISGRVLFRGTPPKPEVLDLSANPTCQRQHVKPVYSEQVVVNRNGTLRNTLVWVKSGLPALRWTPPGQAVTLNQDGCVYQPHVLALMTGQTLEVTNSDPLNHNVHAEAVENAAFNVAQPPRAEKILKQFSRQEIMFPVTCGVHPWMRAYLAVIAHPFFTVTGADGTFELKGLPPGTYSLEAVHELYGHQQVTITLAPKDRKELNFTYTAKPG